MSAKTKREVTGGEALKIVFFGSSDCPKTIELNGVEYINISYMQKANKQAERRGRRATEFYLQLEKLEQENKERAQIIATLNGQIASLLSRNEDAEAWQHHAENVGADLGLTLAELATVRAELEEAREALAAVRSGRDKLEELHIVTDNDRKLLGIAVQDVIQWLGILDRSLDPAAVPREVWAYGSHKTTAIHNYLKDLSDTRDRLIELREELGKALETSAPDVMRPDEWAERVNAWQGTPETAVSEFPQPANQGDGPRVIKSDPVVFYVDPTDEIGYPWADDITADFREFEAEEGAAVLPWSHWSKITPQQVIEMSKTPIHPGPVNVDADWGLVDVCESCGQVAYTFTDDPNQGGESCPGCGDNFMIQIMAIPLKWSGPDAPGVGVTAPQDGPEPTPGGVDPTVGEDGEPFTIGGIVDLMRAAGVFDITGGEGQKMGFYNSDTEETPETAVSPSSSSAPDVVRPDEWAERVNVWQETPETAVSPSSNPAEIKNANRGHWSEITPLDVIRLSKTEISGGSGPIDADWGLVALCENCGHVVYTFTNNPAQTAEMCPLCKQMEMFEIMTIPLNSRTHGAEFGGSQ